MKETIIVLKTKSTPKIKKINNKEKIRIQQIRKKLSSKIQFKKKAKYKNNNK